MRWLIGIWLAPLTFYWAWIGLARFNVWPESVIFSRRFYDALFANYEAILGLSESQVLGLMIQITIIDLLLVIGIIAFRKRRAISTWVRGLFADKQGVSLSDKALNADYSGRSVGLAPLAK